MLFKRKFYNEKIIRNGLPSAKSMLLTQNTKAIDVYKSFAIPIQHKRNYITSNNGSYSAEHQYQARRHRSENHDFNKLIVN